METKTSEFKIVGRRKDNLETKAVMETISKVRKEGYLIGTDLLISKEEDGWAIFDLEQQKLFQDKDLLSVVGTFVLMETPKVILDIVNDDIPIIVEPLSN